MGITKGTWNLPGTNIKIPDFGWTEKNAPILGVNPSQVQAFNQTLQQPSSVIDTGVSTTRAYSSPTPQLQQQTGGGGFDMSLYPGWNETEARADFAATGGPNRGSGGGGNQNMIDQINSLYANTNALYDQYITQQLPAELETALGTISTQKTQSERSAATALEQAMADFKSQVGITTQQQRASESTLLNQRNAAIQQGQNRFGGGSSAGPAIYEIINQEFLRSSGNVKVAAQNSFNAIFKEQAKAQSFYSDYLQKMDEDVKNVVKVAGDEFNSRMLQIQMAKAQNEDARTQAKIAVLQQQQQEAQNIQNWKLENVLALETWMAQQKDTLNNSTQYVAELAQRLSTNQMFAGYQGTLSSVPNQQNFSTLNNTNYPNAPTNDPWAEIVNPFS